MMANRRQFIKGALVGSLAVAAGVSIWQLSLEDSQLEVEQDKYDYQYLSIDDRLLLFALLPAYLGPALAPLDSASFRLNLLHQLDQSLGFISESSLEELRELFAILTNQLGRAYLTGVWTNWNNASPADLSEFLNNWRNSFMALLRTGYLGLHQLIFGVFYAQGESWKAIGYPGPPNL